MFVKKTMKGFHAYDIRGIYNKDFNKDDVYKIGFFLIELLGADAVFVGRDMRLSSPEIFQFLSKGITDAGADVHDAGLTTTPMVYWATFHYGFNASVMITASHNPKEYNGFKVSKTDAVAVGYDTGLKTLEEYITTKTPVPVKHTGKIIQVNIKEPYLNFLSRYYSDFSNLKIAVDCSNGMASILAKEVLGKSHYYIYDVPDGTFPNHDPNPLEEENLKDLKALVTGINADVGIIFDGDADRVMFVDEMGNFVPPDLLIALMGHYFLEQRNETGWVIQDIRSSRSVAEYLEPMGAKIYTWRVGRAYAANKLREINGVYGGEVAGHYYFRDFNYSDSAFIACLIVLGIISRFKKEGISFSATIRKIKNWENSGEINFKLSQKDEAINEVKEKYISQKPDRILDFDGYRIEFAHWWFNIRKSNTEPYVRLLVEAKTKDLLSEKVNEIKTIIQKYQQQ